MNKLFTYIKNNKVITFILILNVLIFSYILLFDLKINISIKRDNNVVCEGNYIAPFQSNKN